MFARLVAIHLAIAPAAATSPTPDRPAESGVVRGSHGSGGLRGYLGRELPNGPRHLDHGVIEAGVAGGFPHLYRLQLRLGLLDHLTIGATAHWLPGQRAPGWSPVASVAFLRRRWLEVGASYHQVLHPPPRVDEDPLTPEFQPRTHYVLAGMTFSQSWFAAGFDVGVANLRIPDPSKPDTADAFAVRTRVGGGLHARVGTRRFGLTLQAQAPDVSFEALVDVRFGLFEVRPRGGWLDH